MQDIMWSIDRIWPLSDTAATTWLPDWTEGDYWGNSTEWTPTGSSFAATGDEPNVNWNGPNLFLNSVTFFARTRVKCIEGDDAGSYYGTVLWSWYWNANATPEILVGYGPTIF